MPQCGVHYLEQELVGVTINMSEGGEEVGGLAARSGESEEAAEGDARDLEGEGEEVGMEESHKELARDMFEKITDYLNGELAGLYIILTLCIGHYTRLRSLLESVCTPFMLAC